VTQLRAHYGCRLVAAVVGADAIPVTEYAPPEPFALCVGSEGPGLSAALRSVCDDAITVPMASGADSLNVAVAAAVILHELVRST
jgi:tRNA G18 (ribose-2'-O)-methylase SpoU